MTCWWGQFWGVKVKVAAQQATVAGRSRPALRRVTACQMLATTVDHDHICRQPTVATGSSEGKATVICHGNVVRHAAGC